jgi:hypothetical protein
MLQGWLPSNWALLGGMLAVLRLGVFSNWVNGYYGGALAATGGALVLGALPRIRRRANVRNGVLLAIGTILLANSRPYEGLLVCAPAVAVLCWSALRTHGLELDPSRGFAADGGRPHGALQPARIRQRGDASVSD